MNQTRVKKTDGAQWEMKEEARWSYRVFATLQSWTQSGSSLSVWSLCRDSLLVALRVQSGVKHRDKGGLMCGSIRSVCSMLTFLFLWSHRRHACPSMIPEEKKKSSQSYCQFSCPLLSLYSSSDLFTLSLEIPLFIFLFLLFYTRLTLEYRTMFTHGCDWQWHL